MEKNNSWKDVKAKRKKKTTTKKHRHSTGQDQYPIHSISYRVLRNLQYLSKYYTYHSWFQIIKKDM